MKLLFAVFAIVGLALAGSPSSGEMSRWLSSAAGIAFGRADVEQLMKSTAGLSDDGDEPALSQ